MYQPYRMSGCMTKILAIAICRNLLLFVYFHVGNLHSLGYHYSAVSQFPMPAILDPEDIVCLYGVVSTRPRE